MPRKAKLHALDRLLPGRFWGEGGRGLAPRISRHRETSGCPESLFAPVLTICSQGSEIRLGRGHNARCKQMFVVEREEHRAWT